MVFGNFRETKRCLQNARVPVLTEDREKGRKKKWTWGFSGLCQENGTRELVFCFYVAWVTGAQQCKVAFTSVYPLSTTPERRKNQVKPLQERQVVHQMLRDQDPQQYQVTVNQLCIKLSSFFALPGDFKHPVQPRLTADGLHSPRGNKVAHLRSTASKFILPSMLLSTRTLLTTPCPGHLSGHFLENHLGNST